MGVDEVGRHLVWTWATIEANEPVRLAVAVMVERAGFGINELTEQFHRAAQVAWVGHVHLLASGQGVDPVATRTHLGVVVS
ncbi:hypothetical protein M2272_005877 [Mycobacterium frederiksbergense]|uniref:Uncharacterized protein n=1 Tax=Mycolicibacterium frederiksbergense TaxID=117567 RepID=A0ABT6L8F3_9MYCO|nr:hypothetical protein [Mycolicibacterium frederiksbergense]